MSHVTLTEIALLLAAMAIAPPLARRFGIGTVLGYLLAGVALGPHGIRHVFSSDDAHEILEFSEFGIVLLLFIIGLELRPKRLWAMRAAIFRLGGAQVILTALVLTTAVLLLGQAWKLSLFIGLALALSSTAFALQVLEEQGDLPQRHGRLAFAVLLFQDLAAIPLIALVPLFAVAAAGAAHTMDFTSALFGLGTIAAVVVVGHYGLDIFLRLVARTKVKEAMTAAALLTVVTVSLVMQQAGLSAALGAFIAGALLAESSYRHQIEADIQPFQGLLLGLFFTAIGMSLNLDLVSQEPATIFALAVALVAIKTAILYFLGRKAALDKRPARRFALSLSQGGEFAFVLFTVGFSAGVLDDPTSDLLGGRCHPLDGGDAAPARARARHHAQADTQRWAPCLRRTSGARRARRHRRLRPLRADRRPRPARQEDPDHRARHLARAGGTRAAFRLQGIFTAMRAVPKSWRRPRSARHARSCSPSTTWTPRSRSAEFVRKQYPDVPIFARARNLAFHAHRLYSTSGSRTSPARGVRFPRSSTREVVLGLGFSERESDRGDRYSAERPSAASSRTTLTSSALETLRQ